MADNVSVVNVALTRLGQRTIASLTENTREAQAINAIFDDILELVLALHPWNAATTRFRLPKLATPPVWGPSNAFQLPGDFLRLVRTDFQEEHFRVERDTLISDLDDVDVEYIAKVTDMNLLGPAFRMAMSARLSYELAPKLAGSSRQPTMFGLYKDDLKEAQYQDSLQAPVTSMGGSSWLNARFGVTARTPFRGIENP